METTKKQPNYMMVWLVLFVLTVIEVGVAMIAALPKQVLILILIGLAFGGFRRGSWY